jgi:hypothetical protein
MGFKSQGCPKNPHRRASSGFGENEGRLCRDLVAALLCGIRPWQLSCWAPQIFIFEGPHAP